MNRFHLVLRTVAALVVVAAVASPRRALPALPALPAFADTTPMEYDVGGLHVIHLRRDSSADVIAVQLYLLGGARQVTLANAGVEPLLLWASDYGSRGYPRDAARRALAYTGSSISVSAEVDWTTYSFDGLKQEFDSTWAVFADRLMHPSLDPESVAIVRRRMLSGLAGRASSPENQAWQMAESLAFRGHPYAVEPFGNDKSLRSLTVAHLLAYARDQFVTSRMLLVVVGDIPAEQVKAAIERTVARLPKGQYKWSLPEAWKADSTAIIAVDRQLPTNYIVAYMSGPRRSSPDFPAFTRAMSFLGSWVSDEVREASGLSYAAGVRVLNNGATGAALYLSTSRPDSAIKIVNTILSAYQRNVTIPRHVLRRGAKSYGNDYLASREDASAHAELLARAYIYDGDHRVAGRRAQEMEKITFAELRRMIRTYAKNMQYAFVGDTTLLPREAMTNPDCSVVLYGPRC